MYKLKPLLTYYFIWIAFWILASLLPEKNIRKQTKNKARDNEKREQRTKEETFESYYFKVSSIQRQVYSY